ncbi:hypothetical protein FWH30_00775 [Microgenomates group bacterium]|nr:hypothetical protein [Microgenomates group bacterium]
MKSALKFSCGSAIFALALGLGVARASAQGVVPDPMDQNTVVNLFVAGALNLDCANSVDLSIPAGLGSDVQPVVCTAYTNGPGSYDIEAQLSATLMGSGAATGEQIARIAGNPTYAAPAVLADGATNAWGLHRWAIPASVSCSSLSPEGTAWGVTGNIVASSLAASSTGDEYKFCVGAYVIEPNSAGVYTGNITFTLSSIDLI